MRSVEKDGLMGKITAHAKNINILWYGAVCHVMHLARAIGFRFLSRVWARTISHPRPPPPPTKALGRFGEVAKETFLCLWCVIRFQSFHRVLYVVCTVQPQEHSPPLMRTPTFVKRLSKFRSATRVQMACLVFLLLCVA